jgi:hypothetical protein
MGQVKSQQWDSDSGKGVLPEAAKEKPAEAGWV